MTIKTIEKTRIPGVPDKALVKAASLANTDSRISWSLNNDGQKITQLYYPRSGREITAANNTWLVAELIDQNELLIRSIERLLAQVEELESKHNDH